MGKNFLKSIWFIVIVVVILLCVVGIIYYLNNRVTDEDIYYEKMMNNYGLNKFYDNSSVSSNEKVTHSELVKMIIASSENLDFSSLKNLNDTNFKNDYYVREAEFHNILIKGSVNEKNFSQNPTLYNLFDYLSKAKLSILSQSLNLNNEHLFKDTDSLMNQYLNDLILNDILTEYSNINLNKNIEKRDVNKYIIRFVQKYNLVSFGNKKIVTDQSKLPSNYDIYPYILEEVENYIYEAPLKKYIESESISPIIMFKNFKTKYEDISNVVTDYYNLVLNIDYTNISSKTLLEKINSMVTHPISKEEVDAYVQYVKENKIILQGNVKPCFPVIYYDGEVFRLRAKIDFEVKSSNTLKKLLLFDFILESEYDFKTTNSLVVDTTLGLKRLSEDLYIYSSVIEKSIVL